MCGDILKRTIFVRQRKGKQMGQDARVFVGIGGHRHIGVQVMLAFIQIGIDEKGIARQMRRQRGHFMVIARNIRFHDMIQPHRGDKRKQAPDFQRAFVAQLANEQIDGLARLMRDFFFIQIMQFFDRALPSIALNRR